MQSLLTLGLLAASLTPIPPPDFSGLPPWAPQNPLEANRSVLFASPLLMPSGDWAFNFSFDYASAIEFYSTVTRSVLLDAELGRFQVWATRRIAPGWFVLGQMQIQGAYGGFLDGFIDGYHSLLGVKYIARDLRPHDTFAHDIRYAKGETLRYGPVDLGLGDTRLGIGRMLGEHAQVLLVVGVPTSTNLGYGAGTLQTGLLLSGEAPLLPWLTFSGSLGLGFTPRTGTLAPFENQFFASFSFGPRIRLSWRNFLYFDIFVHTPPFHGTGLNPLDTADFSIDFGWMFRLDRGTELWLSIVEDPYPDGPALDVVFRIGLRTGF